MCFDVQIDILVNEKFANLSFVFYCEYFFYFCYFSSFFLCIMFSYFLCLGLFGVFRCLVVCIGSRLQSCEDRYSEGRNNQSGFP